MAYGENNIQTDWLQSFIEWQADVTISQVAERRLRQLGIDMLEVLTILGDCVVTASNKHPDGCYWTISGSSTDEKLYELYLEVDTNKLDVIVIDLRQL